MGSVPAIMSYPDLYIFIVINLYEKSMGPTTTQGFFSITQIGDFEIRPIRWSDFKGEV